MGQKEAEPPRGKEETEGEEGVPPSLQRPPHPPEIKAAAAAAAYSQRKGTPARWECEGPVRSEITPGRKMWCFDTSCLCIFVFY